MPADPRPTDLHTRVAAAILAQIETADPASWTPPWHGADPMPRNARTGRRYRGINVLALWCSAQAEGYADARWATYRQWAALGAQVRKAERGTLVLFHKDLPRSARVDTGDADAPDGAPFVARAAHVFNAAQVDPAPPTADAVTHAAPPTPLPSFDTFVAATGAQIREGGARACYVEDALAAAHGHPRVPLPPDPAGIGLAYAADPTTIDRHLGDGPRARRLKAELRRRQAVVREAAATAGLPAARARETVTARALGAAGAALLIAPCQTLRDFRLKLVVLIAAGEPGPDDASAFPWWYLRVLAADLNPSSFHSEKRI